jgi:hypothetical protein
MILVLSYGADVVPRNAFERQTAILLMLFGGCVYAYLIGTMCGLLSISDPASQEYQNMSDLLNRYIRENDIRGEQRIRLREFFNHFKEGIRMKYYASLIGMLSPSLQRELAMRVHEQRMSSIPSLCVSDPLERTRFLADVVIALKPAVFPPHEVRCRRRRHERDRSISFERAVVARRTRLFEKRRDAR